MPTVLIVLLVLLLVGALGGAPQWGYMPSGGIGLLLLILVVLAISGRL